MARQSALKLNQLEDALPRHVLKAVSGGNAQTKVDDGSNSGVAMAAVADSTGNAQNGASGYASASAGTSITSGGGSYGFSSGMQASAGGEVHGTAGPASGSISGEVGVKSGVAAEVHHTANDTGASFKAGSVAYATATAEGKIGAGGVSISGGVEATAKTGTYAEGSANVQHGNGAYGAAGAGSAFTGQGVEVGYPQGAGVKNIGSGSAGAGVGIGEMAGVGGSANAGYDNGKINLGVSGDIALLVGVKVDSSLTIDTKYAQDGVKAVTPGATDAGLKVAEVGKDVGTKVGAETKATADKAAAETKALADKAAADAKAAADKAASQAKAAAESAAKAASDAAKKVGNAFKKIKKKW